MGSKYTESDLREWLRLTWEDPLDWTEFGLGGTAGLPDVEIPVPMDDGSVFRLKTELKWWKMNRLEEVIGRPRPSQNRFHRLESAKGNPTAFLVGASLVHSKIGRARIWIFPSKFLRKIGNKHFPDNTRCPWEIVANVSSLGDTDYKAVLIEKLRWVIECYK